MASLYIHWKIGSLKNLNFIFNNLIKHDQNGRKN